MGTEQGTISAPVAHILEATDPCTGTSRMFTAPSAAEVEKKVHAWLDELFDTDEGLSAELALLDDGITWDP